MQNVTQILMAGHGVIDMCRVLSHMLECELHAQRCLRLCARPLCCHCQTGTFLHTRTYDVTDAMALWHINSRLCFS